MYKMWKKLKKVSRFGAPRRGFRAELLTRLHASPDWPAPVQVRPAFAFRFATAALVVVIVLAGGGAYVYASPSVAADHPLYRVKRSVETLGYKLKRTPLERARFQKKILHRRLDEVEYARRAAPVMAANQELVQFIKEIKSLPREERRAAIMEIKQRVRERRLEVQTELLKESEKEFDVPPSVVEPFAVPVVPTFPTDTLPVKEIEQEKLPSTTTLDTSVENKYPNLSP